MNNLLALLETKAIEIEKIADEIFGICSMPVKNKEEISEKLWSVIDRLRLVDDSLLEITYELKEEE